MKRARISIGAVLIGGILAFFLSWPIKKLHYKDIKTTIPTVLYDKVMPKSNPIVLLKTFAHWR
jgi:nitrogen fixation-related uncharacterized protein